MCEGWCYIRNTEDCFKKYWCYIKGTELYCCKQQNCDKFDIMHSLVNTFIETVPPFQSTTQQLHPVKILLAKTKIRILYFSSASEQHHWFHHLRTVADMRDFHEFYTLANQLGKGQFGIVNVARHVTSKEEYAVKQVVKEKMTPMEVTQHLREIEVLKMCHHGNIVKLVDYFETSL